MITRGLSILILLLFLGACRNEPSEREKQLADLDKAIYIITDRMEAQEELLKELQRLRAVYEEGLHGAHTTGMKEHIKGEIREAEVLIDRAQAHKSNQLHILTELEQKRDSLEGLAGEE